MVKIPNVGTEGICEIVAQRYPGFLYIVTGDYSGDTVSSIYKEQVTNYTVIKNILKLNDGQIQITPNPPLKKNRTLVNMIFNSYNVQICPVKGQPIIFDCENVKALADGTIDKGDRKDVTKQADCLDTARYFFNQFMGWMKNKVMTKEPKLFDVDMEISDKIHAMEPIICRKEEYERRIRERIMKTVELLMESKPDKARFGLNEIKRLDAMFLK